MAEPEKQLIINILIETLAVSHSLTQGSLGVPESERTDLDVSDILAIAMKIEISADASRRFTEAELQALIDRALEVCCVKFGYEPGEFRAVVRVRDRRESPAVEAWAQAAGLTVEDFFVRRATAIERLADIAKQEES